MIRKIDHINIKMSRQSMKKTVKLFTEKLGFRIDGTLYDPDPEDKEIFYKKVFLKAGELILELHMVEEGEKSGVDHIAFETDDFEKASEMLEAKGVGYVAGFKPASGRRLYNLEVGEVNLDWINYIQLCRVEGRGIFEKPKEVIIQDLSTMFDRSFASEIAKYITKRE